MFSPLALHLALPIWSNDRDFEVSGIDCFTTARLAAILLGTSSR
jgi:hypothetical protein